MQEDKKAAAQEAPEFRLAAPNMMVKDLDLALAFYIGKLGFVETGRGPNCAGVRRDKIEIGLIEATERRPAGTSWCYLTVAGVEALFKAYEAAGVKIVAPLQDWGGGHAEFTINDCDGNKIDIGN